MSRIFPPVMGVDPNSHELACVWGIPGNSVEFERVKLIRGNAIDGTGVAFNKFGYLLNDIAEEFGMPPRVFMEAPVQVSNRVGSLLPQAFIQGAVMAACAEWKCMFTHVNNQAWKKQVLGDGGISKDEIALRLEEIWPDFVSMEGITGDLIDAGAIYLYGVRRVRMTAAIQRRGRGRRDSEDQEKEAAGTGV